MLKEQNSLIEKPFVNENTTLDDFLVNWDERYKLQAKILDLFKTEFSSSWNFTQKQYFIALLYHQRGHFHDLLWTLANFAPTKADKESILDNIRDELGGERTSHEQLYFNFANSFNVSLEYELIEEKFYLSFLKEYNKGHLIWLKSHSWLHQLIAFAAIERLDNLDYTILRDVAVNIGTPNDALKFFNVHIYVKHYEAFANPRFQNIWQEYPYLIKEVFDFIGNYQLNIWEKIGSEVKKIDKADSFFK